jgi:subtilisin family serine protease
MPALRITLTCGAGLAALVLASAIPAASGPTRPVSAGFQRLSAPGNVVERLDSEWDGPRTPASAAFPAVAGGRVRVVVESSDPAATRQAVEAAGGVVERAQRGLVQASVPRSAVAGLERRASTDLVRAPMRFLPDAVAGEEVAASLAPAWHAKGFTGKNVKIAIIDAGFVGLADRQASGDLPANVVTQDLCGGKFATADSHGTAVAEIVYEMAPEAQLYLICINTEVELAAAVAYAKSQGVHVISHSASWFGPVRGDGSGFFGALAADARAAGILWVNSAGNYAQTHWSGTFSGASRSFHVFAPGDQGNTFIWPNNSSICGFLRWDEWPAARSDFDLLLVHSTTGQIIGVSDDEQTGSQPAVEGLCMRQTTGASQTMAWFIGGYNVVSTPRLDMFTFSPPLQYQTAAGSLLEPATSPAALTVGAVCWQSKAPEYFSSQGPTVDGRVKPDIAGHDSVTSGTYGPFSACGMSGFAGTSAAAPEVAGAAALVKQAFPSYTPDQLQQYLVKSVVDSGAPGPDNVTGAGELQLPKPPDLVPPTGKALASSGKAGKVVKLLSSVADDEGIVSVVEQVKRNGAVIKTIKQPGTVAATSPRTVAVPWQAPAKPKGSYQHCVIATDAAGNKSPSSCAKVTIK